VNESFNETSSNEDFNKLLQQLAQEAQQHPPLSSQRQLALSKLVHEILRSRQLVRPQKGRWTSDLYENFYNEALQKTLLDVCQKIDNYNSTHPVMAWVNFLFKNYFINVVNERDRQGITYLPKNEIKKTIRILSLDELDRYSPLEEAFSKAQLLRQFLEDDPENLFANERLRDRPEVTFQYLAIAKFVEDRTWDDIATKLGISLQTLCSFFERRLQKLMPYFKKYLQE
jgi:DNA-directed RNA polymerase specialized sigma24 family protein